MGGIISAGHIRKRSNDVFDPANEPGLTLRAWWDFHLATVDGSNRILTVPDRGGTSRALTRKSGSIGPLFTSSVSTLGAKSAGYFPFDNVNHAGMQCTNIGFTGSYTMIMIGQQDVPLAGQTPDQLSRIQYFFDQDTQAGMYTSGTSDELRLVGGYNSYSLNCGIAPKKKPFVIVTYNAGGTACNIAINTNVADNTGQVGTNVTANPVYIGVSAGGAASQVFAGYMAAILIFDGALTQTQLVRALLRFQAEYKLAITFDEPGTIFRKKYFVDAFSSAVYVTETSIQTKLAASGAIRAKLLVNMKKESSDKGSMDGIVTQGTTWYAARTGDAVCSIVAGGTEYKTLAGIAWGGSVTAQRETEVFVSFGDGGEPKFAARDDTSLPYVEVPFPAGTTIAPFSPTGSFDVGGDSATIGGADNNSPSSPIPGVIRELITYRDNGKPGAYTPPTYTAGALVWWGDDLAANAQTSGHPFYTIQQLLIANKYSYPRWRCVGTVSRTLAQLTTDRSTVIDPLYVSGGNNIIVLSAGLRTLLTATTAAAAYTSLASLASTLKTAGWKVAVCTVPTTTGLSLDETKRTTFNASIVSGNPGDKVIDWGAMTGFVNIYAGVAPDNTTARAMGALTAAQLTGWL